MTAISIRGLSKAYGDTLAVDRVSLDIADGHLFFLLGPSGCGKTTLLRMIAGFIEPTRGSILFDGRDVARIPPEKRNTGMVFQSYALWPHMTVAENVAFGLKVRKLSRSDRDSRVAEALDMVQMGSYAGRRPNALSGGQQQRVALARALAIRPDVLLLDEPLSNLDAKLRLEMRSEIRRLVSQLKITTVYVTHDQKEALSLADDMAVLRQGVVVQSGPPRLLYERPNSMFVADFLGETNFLAATVSELATGPEGLIAVETSFGPMRGIGQDGVAKGQRVTVSIRPETIHVARGDASGSAVRLHARLLSSTYLGEVAQHALRLESPAGNAVLKMLEIHPGPFQPPGTMIDVAIQSKDIMILPPEADSIREASLESTPVLA